MNFFKIISFFFALNLFAVNLAFAATNSFTATFNLQNNTVGTLPAVGSRCQDNDYSNRIRKLWMARKPALVKLIITSDVEPYSLYNIQIETNNLLTYSAACDDSYILEELMDLYSLALATLDSTDQYKYYFYPNTNIRLKVSPLPRVYKFWRRKSASSEDTDQVEDILSSAQFIFVISNMLDILSRIDNEKKSDQMMKFVTVWSPVVFDHYQRWILNPVGPVQVKGWGCTYQGKPVQTGMNHHVSIVKLYERSMGDNSSKKYCNAVHDHDLLIIGGVAHFLAAHARVPDRIQLASEHRAALLEYVRIGSRLVESRMSSSQLINFQGQAVNGLNFDLGASDDYADNNFAGYTAATFPENESLPILGKNLGWDISHARRFVNFFQAMYKNRTALGLTFPTQITMQGIANQFVYGVFNRDFEKPLFSNYMDGTNGWFRVGYSKRMGFGYQPSGQSEVALTGGYAFLSEYSTDMSYLYCKLDVMLASEHPDVRRHVIENYETGIFQNHVRRRAYNYKSTNDAVAQSSLLQFFPSIYAVGKNCS